MAHGSGKQVRCFSFVLRGGPPWGFTLSGGSEVYAPLLITQLDISGKAKRAGITVGDIVSGINDQECKSHEVAVQKITICKDLLKLSILRYESAAVETSANVTPRSVHSFAEGGSRRIALMQSLATNDNRDLDRFIPESRVAKDTSKMNRSQSIPTSRSAFGERRGQSHSRLPDPPARDFSSKVAMAAWSRTPTKSTSQSALNHQLLHGVPSDFSQESIPTSYSKNPSADYHALHMNRGQPSGHSYQPIRPDPSSQHSYASQQCNDLSSNIAAAQHILQTQQRHPHVPRPHSSGDVWDERFLNANDERPHTSLDHYPTSGLMHPPPTSPPPRDFDRFSRSEKSFASSRYFSPTNRLPSSSVEKFVLDAMEKEDVCRVHSMESLASPPSTTVMSPVRRSPHLSAKSLSCDPICSTPSMEQFHHRRSASYLSATDGLLSFDEPDEDVGHVGVSAKGQLPVNTTKSYTKTQSVDRENPPDYSSDSFSSTIPLRHYSDPLVEGRGGYNNVTSKPNPERNVINHAYTGSFPDSTATYSKSNNSNSSNRLTSFAELRSSWHGRRPLCFSSQHLLNPSEVISHPAVPKQTGTHVMSETSGISEIGVSQKASAFKQLYGHLDTSLLKPPPLPKSYGSNSPRQIANHNLEKRFHSEIDVSKESDKSPVSSKTMQVHDDLSAALSSNKSHSKLSTLERHSSESNLIDMVGLSYSHRTLSSECILSRASSVEDLLRVHGDSELSVMSLLDKLKEKLKDLQLEKSELNEAYDANELERSTIKQQLTDYCTERDLRRFDQYLIDVAKVLRLQLQIDTRIQRLRNKLSIVTSSEKERILKESIAVEENKLDSAETLYRDVMERGNSLETTLASKLPEEACQYFVNFIQTRVHIVRESYKTDSLLRTVEEQISKVSHYSDK